MFSLEELQKMSKNELIKIIGNYISDQEIWMNQVKELEKYNDKKSDEIERLTEEKKTLVWLNQDLKKQVDELKEQRDVFKRLFEACNNSSVTTEEIINTMNSFYREQAEHLAELKIEQTVKDKVKEILDKLMEIYADNPIVIERHLQDVFKSEWGGVLK